ncbi:gamma-glutamyltranspeptidase [Cladochytrium replicatum]|nr:gamma-glutamyltranspeptidase [Cladochytrium replicatum]
MSLGLPSYSPLASDEKSPALTSDQLLDKMQSSWPRKTRRSLFPRSFSRSASILALGSGLLLFATAVLYIDSQNLSPTPRKYFPTRLVSSPHAAVASENELCSIIGRDVLQDGGNAVDSVVAASICIGVTNMYSSGIGGGGFLVLRTPNGKSEYIDFREEAPAAASRDMYEGNPTGSMIGGLSVGVPGEIRGFEYAHKKYGKLPWKRLFEPSIELCLNGWTVNRVLAMRINTYAGLMLNNTEFSEVFAPNGRILVEGDTIRRTALGHTLRAIADEGPEVFYTGWIGKSLVDTTRANGGILTMKDMSAYEVKTSLPLVGTYRDRKIITSPPPSSGPVLLSVLNILEGYALGKEGRTQLNFHRIVEAFKHGFSQRSFYGDPSDPEFANITEIADDFMRKEKAEDIRARIFSDRTFDPSYYNAEFDILDDHGTMHVSVIDSDGMATSLTSTVNLVFGAQLMDAKTGIILNDEMDDFSQPNITNYFGLKPSPYNFIKPKKRPLSSCVPTIVERDGQVEFVVGASGGSRIITATAQAIVNAIDFGMNPLEAIDDPRFHDQLYPNEVMVEHEFSDGFTKGLLRRGHTISRMAEGYYLTGVSMVQRRSDGVVLAAGDHRKGGAAAGY